MLCIYKFNEAHQQYQNGNIPYRLLQDQAAVMIGLCDTPHPNIIHAWEITEANIEWLLQQEEAGFDYSDLLGGNVYVCETEKDLMQINGCDFDWADSHGGQWPNVTDQPMVWDSCAYVDEGKGEPQWIMFLLCWNNAGGPVYYVPKHLWEAARVIEHIEATQRAWGS